jgi:hypothetical protein
VWPGGEVQAEQRRALAETVMHSERLRLKIGGAILAVILVAFGVTTTLSYFVYERTLLDLLVSRFELVAKELRLEIEASLDLGLPLGELDNLEHLLIQRDEADDQIVGITVFTARGTIAFDTDAAAIGKAVPAAWASALAQGEGALSRSGAIGDFAVGTSLSNSFGKLVGGLVIRFNSDYFNGKIRNVLFRLAEIGGLAIALGGLLALAGVFVITEPLSYFLIRLETALRLMLRRIGRPLEDPLPPELRASFEALEHDLNDTITRLRAAEQRLDAPRVTGVMPRQAIG